MSFTRDKNKMIGGLTRDFTLFFVIKKQKKIYEDK